MRPVSKRLREERAYSSWVATHWAEQGVRCGAGAEEPVFTALLSLAERLADAAGTTLHFRQHLSLVELATWPAETRGYVLAAVEIYDLASKTANGREALKHLGFQPVLENVERE